MDMATIAGMLISGFATRLYGIGMAVWVAVEASEPLKSAMSAADATIAAANAIN